MSALAQSARFSALLGEADRLDGLAADVLARASDALARAVAVQHHDHAAARTYVEMERRAHAEAGELIGEAAKLRRRALSA